MTSEAKPEEKPAAPPPPIAGKARDLESLRNAVVDAANVGTGFWFSYLFVLLYFIVAVGTVTHRTLFFESSVKLPIVGVDLPLIGFFVLGPLLFLIVHAYILLHFVLLADKVGAFHAELQAQIADDDIRTSLRRQLPSNIFVQFLAGPREVRTGLMGMMLRLIALISLVLGPLALLLFFVVQFLPYHSEIVTWWHRIAVVIDLALLWALWPTIVAGNATSIGVADFLRPSVVVAAVASVLALIFAFATATFPDEWLYRRNPVAWTLVPQFNGSRVEWVTPHVALFAGTVDLLERRRTSLWSNSLVLPNLEQPEKTFSARGRRLNHAIFLSANLSKVDFSGAQLDGAIFASADLSGAKFPCAARNFEVRSAADQQSSFPVSDSQCTSLKGAMFYSARLQGADLTRAELKDASFQFAHLQGAVLNAAKLQKANFNYAELQGATLDGAQLEGATLDHAQLKGASLKGAGLQHANLKDASLQGAVLDGATLRGTTLAPALLQGASLENASLHGARLQGAQFQGASLKRATLYGANLSAAQLHGADLEGAKLDGAILDFAWLQGVVLKDATIKGVSLENAFVWRTDPRGADFENPFAPSIESGPIFSISPYHCLDERTPCRWTAAWYLKLKNLIERQVPEGPMRTAAFKRIAILDPAAAPPAEAESTKRWEDLGAATSTEGYRKTLASVLINVSCDTYGGLDIYRALYENLFGRVRIGSPEFRTVADTLLDKEHCASMAGAPDSFKDKLRQDRDSSPARPPRGPQQPPAQQIWP